MVNRNRSRLSRAMARLRGSIETRRVLDELEWHRWFAWYPVVVATDNERAYWAWLQFVERKTHCSRSTGEWILRYRSALRRAQRAAHEPRTNKLNSSVRKHLAANPNSILLAVASSPDNKCLAVSGQD